MDDITSFLGDIAGYYGGYHRHKETSAWAGVVLFVSLNIWLIGKLGTSVHTSVQSKCAFSSILAVLLLAFLVYLRQQFRARKRAADIVAACFALRSELVGQDSTIPSRADYLPPERGDGEFQSSHVLPRAVLDRADQIGSVGQGVRRKLELAAYTIVVVVAVFAIGTIWWA